MTAPVKAETKPSLKSQLMAAELAVAAVIPRHLDAAKVVRVAWLACAKDPKLRAADAMQVVASVVKAASLGLTVGQNAHLVPFYNKAAGTYDVVLIPDYRGLIDLARRSNLVLDVEARAVFQGEEFTVEYGAEPKLRHVPAWDADRSYAKLVAVYAIAVLPGGEDGSPPLRRWDVMTRTEVEAIKARSRAKDGPWVTDPVEMAKKTVIRRICKTLPQSPELMAALELDLRAETGTIETVLDGDDEAALRAAGTAKLAGQTEKLTRRLKAGSKKAEPEPQPEEPTRAEVEALLKAAREANDEDAIEALSIRLEQLRGDAQEGA